MPQSTAPQSANVKKTVLALSLAAATTASSAAQTVSELPIDEDIKRLILSSLTAPAVAPGMSQSSPVGFGADWGTLFASVGGSQNPETSRNNGADEVDGSISFGAGLGDADGIAALEVTVNIISLTDNGADSDFGEDGDVGLKLHKRITGSTSLAIGAENVTGWGAADHDQPGKQHSAYVAATHVSALAPYNAENPWAYTLTVGVGSGRFLDQKDNADDDSVNVFGSASLAFLRNAAAIADWNGSSLGLSVSVVPFPDMPLTFTAGVIDVTDRLDEGVRYTGGVGYTYNFK